MSTETLSFHCTTCPNNCLLHVEVETAADGSKVAKEIGGNRCGRGITFAKTEVSRPERVLATTVVIHNGDEQLLPVRTKTAIPFDKHAEAMHLLRTTAIYAPIKMGDVVVRNILNTGVDVVASMDVAKL